MVQMLCDVDILLACILRMRMHQGYKLCWDAGDRCKIQHCMIAYIES